MCAYHVDSDTENVKDEANFHHGEAGHAGGLGERELVISVTFAERELLISVVFVERELVIRVIFVERE